ncbi:FecR domain-containing protein [Pedobacter sp. ASV1-7]|uniref:FecR family protein n=1 Tax=Pedobacter sp. ASV1-7 TaxID=3145237 RepID=UPI0032E868F5
MKDKIDLHNLTNDIRIGKLIALSLTGNLDVKEQAELNLWIDKSERNALIFDKIKDETSLSKGLAELEEIDAEQALQQFRGRIRETQKIKRVKSISYWPRIAAAAIFIIIGAFFFYFTKVNIGNSDIISYQEDIQPGKNKAQLVLASGKTISLSEAKTGVVIDQRKIAYNDGTEINSASINLTSDTDGSKDGSQLNRLSTPQGGQYQIVLADGTRVWLNAASSLKFPSAFKSDIRNVELIGEAYFEVAKSKIPFIVVANNQEVEVLGTHFNINSYADERYIKTTLIEGLVRVSLFDSKLSGSAANPVKLFPGQQSVNYGSNLKVVEVQTESVVDWKNGDFIFKKENLSQIMRKVARWYDVKVVYDNNIDLNQTFSGQVSRSKNISEILRGLQSTGRIKFKIEHKTVTVMQ